MENEVAYQIHCDCGDIALTLQGAPIVHAYCHCQDCRDLLNVTMHAVAAWRADAARITKGAEALMEYPYPNKAMKRCTCRSCGAVVFNTNAWDWVVVSQALLRKCYGNRLPAELESDKHVFYAERVIDIDDSLPKYLKGVDGPLHKNS